ncbi:hypothetical protein DL95DRAFT_406041 [Leptodontidium sp. 2 PMI_412]|nr:hypothetical protein DL95DRAFT_406041 [Leptodontidium sp. 2 PMI_412]
MNPCYLETIFPEEVIKAVARNKERGKEVMKLSLKQRRHHVVITEEVVEFIACRFDQEIMMLLLKMREAGVVITEELIKAAAGNWRIGKEVTKLLLEQRGPDIVITDSVVQLVAQKLGREAMLSLLENSKADVAITLDGVKWIDCLYRSFHEDGQFTQFYNAAKTGDERVIRELLGQGVDPEIKNSRDVSPTLDRSILWSFWSSEITT